MEVVFVNNSFRSNLQLNEVIAAFFKQHSPESAAALFFKILQCWSLKDCRIKADISDEEIALFLDQLIELVAAAYVAHQCEQGTFKQSGGRTNG